MLKPSKPCASCKGWQWDRGGGFVPASGSGDNGVLILAEAAGEHEVKEGMPLVGKAGYYLFQNLQRTGIEREGFRIHNVLSCRPPDNKLAKMPYELEVIQTCQPLRDATILNHVAHAREIGKTPVIVTLGRIAFKAVMGLTDKSRLMHGDYQAYPHWSSTYQCWVLAADHPSYLMRGNNHLLPVLMFVFTRALEIASGGLTLTPPEYMLDPAPETFSQWVNDYLRHLHVHPETVLSYDIETPYKAGKNEEKVAREDDDDYTILRCGFAYIPNRAVTVPWNASYRPYLEQLFAAEGAKVGWNNSNYDSKRVRFQMPMAGDEIDAMLAWHVLNSALPKGLGFVTPFYAKSTSMWKHLSDAEPAFYNAKDADMALINYLGITKDLEKTDLGKVFNRHVIQLNRVLAYMSDQGVLRDEGLRKDSEVKLQDLLDKVEERMVIAVPDEARKFQIYKKTPLAVKTLLDAGAPVVGFVEREVSSPVNRCSICGVENPKKAHFKQVSAKKLKLGLDNVCQDATVVITTEKVKRWAKPLEWKVSKVGLTSYQKSLKHLAIRNRREGKVTFDEDAIKKLIKSYPKDPLYPAILEHREVSKLLGTYIGVTRYVEVSVPDDYILQPGEEFKDAI